METDLNTYWAMRKQRSLRAARDAGAAVDVLAAIYRWSSRQKRWGDNAGNWVTNMEHQCWEKQPKLRELAKRAGGWWCWRNGVVFVPMKRWQQHHAVFQRHQAALVEMLVTRTALERFKGWLSKQEAQAK